MRLILNAPLTLLQLQKQADNVFYLNYNYVSYYHVRTYLNDALRNGRDLIFDFKDSNLIDPDILDGVFHLFDYPKVANSCIGIISDIKYFNIVSLLPFVKKTKGRQFWLYFNYNDYSIFNDNFTLLRELPNMRDINISFLLSKSLAATALIKHEAEGRICLVDKVKEFNSDYSYPFDFKSIKFNLLGINSIKELVKLVESHYFYSVITSYPIKHGLHLRKLVELSPRIPPLDFIGENPKNLSFIASQIRKFKHLLCETAIV